MAHPFSMQTHTRCIDIACITLGAGRGCYIVVIKLSLEERNLIIYNPVITFQSHEVQGINNATGSVCMKKQMAPPPGLPSLTFRPLWFCISWRVSYITGQINDFGVQMSPWRHIPTSIWVFNQSYIAFSDWVGWRSYVMTCTEIGEGRCLRD